MITAAIIGLIGGATTTGLTLDAARKAQGKQLEFAKEQAYATNQGTTSALEIGAIALLGFGVGYLLMKFV